MGCIASCLENYNLQKCTLENTPEFSLKGIQMKAKVVKVYDGDTVTLAFFYAGRAVHKSCRLLGIDAAEIRTENKKEKEVALEGKAFLTNAILNKVIFILCDGWDKYGRLLVTIFYTEGDTVSINDLLVQHGFAYVYNGDKKQPFSVWHM